MERVAEVDEARHFSLPAAVRAPRHARVVGDTRSDSRRGARVRDEGGTYFGAISKNDARRRCGHQLANVIAAPPFLGMSDSRASSRPPRIVLGRRARGASTRCAEIRQKAADLLEGLVSVSTTLSTPPPGPESRRAERLLVDGRAEGALHHGRAGHDTWERPRTITEKCEQATRAARGQPPDESPPPPPGSPDIAAATMSQAGLPGEYVRPVPRRSSAAPPRCRRRAGPTAAQLARSCARCTPACRRWRRRGAAAHREVVAADNQPASVDPPRAITKFGGAYGDQPSLVLGGAGQRAGLVERVLVEQRSMRSRTVRRRPCADARCSPRRPGCAPARCDASALRRLLPHKASEGACPLPTSPRKNIEGWRPSGPPGSDCAGEAALESGNMIA